LSGGTTLPLQLPFQLQGSKITEETFSIDAYSGWRTIKIKLVHNATNATDEIKIHERSIISFVTPYQQEG
jgi:hypothetical protein